MLETLGEVTGSLGRPGELLLFGRPDDGPPPLPKKELVERVVPPLVAGNGWYRSSSPSGISVDVVGA